MPSTLNGFTVPQWGFVSKMSVSARNPAQQAAKAVAAGATIVRDDIPWAWSEGGSTRPGSYNWATFEAVMSNAHANGLKVIAQIGFCPQWANGSTNDKVPPSPGNYQFFADFARAVVLRAKANYPGTLIAIEVWNEPNQGGFFVGHDATVYTALAQKVYETVNGINPVAADADPTVEVWGGSTAGVGDLTTWGDYVWLTNALNAGVLNHVDAWCCHPYQWDTNETGAFMTNTSGGGGFSRAFWTDPSGTNLITRLLAHGYTGKLHSTEWGAPTNAYPSGTVPRGTSEQNQKDMFTLGWPLWKAQAHAGHLMFYEVQDKLSSDTTDPENHFGAYHTDFSAKSVVTAMLANPNNSAAGGGGGAGAGGASTFKNLVEGFAGTVAFWDNYAASPVTADVGAISLTTAGSGNTFNQTSLTGDTAEKTVTLNGSGTLTGGDVLDTTLDSNAWSIIAVVKPSELTSGTFYGILTKWASAAGIQAWLNNNAGALRFGVQRNAISTQCVANSDIAVGTRSLVVATYDGTTLSAYVNKVKGAAPNSQVVVDNAGVLTIGGGGTGSNFKGTIGPIAILNTALLETDVDNLVDSLDVVPSGTPFPSNSVAPAVTGTAVVGSTLTTTTGTWTDGTPVFTYQWQRDNLGGGVYLNIPGATATTHVLVDADDGCQVRCIVTDTDEVGATSANSNAVAITEPVPVITTPPVASGTPAVRSSLSVTPGVWTNLGGSVATYAYQWQSSGDSSAWSNISATSSSYTTAKTDLGLYFRCNVTVTNTGGASSSSASNALGPITSSDFLLTPRIPTHLILVPK